MKTVRTPDGGDTLVIWYMVHALFDSQQKIVISLSDK